MASAAAFGVERSDNGHAGHAPAVAVEEAVAADVFRRVFRQHAAGVTVVTVAGPDGPTGFTATSLSSVSLDPPLLSIVVANRASSWPALAVAGGFVVNLLGGGAKELADRFATPGVDRFAAPTSWTELPTGEPRLDDVRGFLRCQVVDRVPLGDHHLVVGRVVEAGVGKPDVPLLYHDGDYHTLASLPERSRIGRGLASPPAPLRSGVIALVGNPRPGSRTAQAARIVLDLVADDLRVGPRDLIDLSTVASPLGADAAEQLSSQIERVSRAAAIIVASPTYKASYTGLLKAFLDLLPPFALRGATAIPLMTVGSREHSLTADLHLRPVLQELGASLPTPSLVLAEPVLADPGQEIESWWSTAAHTLRGIGTFATAS